jgi:hypothetical protein
MMRDESAVLGNYVACYLGPVRLSWVTRPSPSQTVTEQPRLGQALA